jgi:hypothetical protein
LGVLGALVAGSTPVAAYGPEDGASREPYLSVRTGLHCSQCHTNRTGGGGRNQFGSVYAQAFLPWQKRSFQGRSLNSFISVGGNLRLAASGTVSGSTPRTSLAVTEANIQVEARLVPDALAVYVDQTIGPGSAASREIFGLLEGLPLDGYVKAGKFLLPFGVRLLDDQEFIRERTGFSYKTPDTGWEVGIEPGPLSFFLAVTNGTQGGDENNSGKQVTATGALIFRHWRLGASASRNDAPDARRDVLGGFGGLNLGRLTFLGELDVIVDSPEDGNELEQLAAYVEANFLAAPGLNAKVTYGFLDPSADIGENARTRMRFGLEWFPIPFLQLSSFYTVLEDIPQSTTDLDQLSLELHAYF